MKPLFCSFFALCLACGVVRAAEPYAWKAGLARVKITPRELMPMAGYAARTGPAEGVAQDLFAKALALEDADGNRLVMVTTDLIGIPRQLRDAVQRQSGERFQLPPAGLLLNASHTHCGPEFRPRAEQTYGSESEEARQAHDYHDWLRDELVKLVGAALADLQPARVGYSHARCGFAMNRRLPTGGGYRNSPYPDGPVDHEVPVLRIDDPQGRLRGVMFGYACHNTTLGFQKFCGDYAGYAQQYLEESHPDAVALFMMGCGGDQNPYPRRTIELARIHGRTLATAVEAALEPEPRLLTGPLAGAYQTVSLDFAPPPSRAELERRLQSPNKYEADHARRLLEMLDHQGHITSSYEYPVQVIRLGPSLLMAALAGEVVVDYSLRLKRELGETTTVWVAGYSNDVFAYIPSRRVLEEGGYEGGGAMIYGTLPGPWAPDIEQRILDAVHAQARQTAAALHP